MAKAKKKKAVKEPMLVASKVKAYLNAQGVKVAGDVVDALNEVVAGLLDKAVERAQANKRATVRASDL